MIVGTEWGFRKWLKNRDFIGDFGVILSELVMNSF